MSSPARQLLKQATALKREKRFDEACEALRKAYAAASPGEFTLVDFMRLPAYLQLAGRPDDAWRELNHLNIRSTNPGYQAAVARVMASFLLGEGRHKDAVIHEAWAICMEVEAGRRFVRAAESEADARPERERGNILAEVVSIGILVEANQVANQPNAPRTAKGNAILDVAYPSQLTGLRNAMDRENIRVRLGRCLGDSVSDKIKKAVSGAVAGYIEFPGKFDRFLLRNICAIHLLGDEGDDPHRVPTRRTQE